MAKKPGLEQMRWDIQDRLPTLPAATVRRLWQLMTKDEPVEVIDPEIVAAIKDRDSRTDHYGDDLVFTVLHDLCDREYVHRFMPERQAATDKFQKLPEDKRMRIVREVLNEWGGDDG